MGYGSNSLEKRIKENIKDYTLGQLLDPALIQRQLELLSELTKGEFLVTRRHGEPICRIGEWDEEPVDVMANQGIRIRINDRTVGHFYYRTKENGDVVDALVENLIAEWQAWGENTYLYRETDQYVDELTLRVEHELSQRSRGIKLDTLTGVMNHVYFNERMKVMDRSQMAPLSVLCVNVNDWKYANDRYGVEESDRLLRIVADILKRFAKTEYVIGRVDLDVFNIIIPMPEEGEAQQYKETIQRECDSFEDPRLAPSIAVGIAMKENVEEALEQIFSDAEYEMFENKMMMKQLPGYKERLYKGEN